MIILQTITVHCGLKNYPYIENQSNCELPLFSPLNNESRFFWPVLEAVSSLPKITTKIFSNPYKLIFSSKTAIDFFYKEIYEKNLNILTHCQAVFFVGEKSKSYFKNMFVGYDNNLLFCSTTTGMKSVIQDFKLKNSNKTLIFMTTEFGISKTTIESCHFKTKPIILNIYKLIPFYSDFLKLIFNSINLHNNQKIIFECRSGKVLEQVVIFLKKYFLCENIHSLPKNILFSCIGKSTVHKFNKLNAQYKN